MLRDIAGSLTKSLDLMFTVRVHTAILIVGTKISRFKTPNRIVNKANSENKGKVLRH